MATKKVEKKLPVPMLDGKYGIKETKELAEGVVAVVNVGVKALEDGKIGFDDSYLAATAIKPVVQAINGIQEVQKEQADASPAEIKEVEAILEKLELESDEDERDSETAMKGFAAISRMIARRSKTANQLQPAG